MVAALIRELIITGEFTTGEQLRQRDLAQRFGVSQTPVREVSLTHWHIMGVKHRPGPGAP